MSLIVVNSGEWAPKNRGLPILREMLTDAAKKKEKRLAAALEILARRVS